MPKGRLLSRSGAPSSLRMNRAKLHHSRQQETRVAKELGGARTSGSGNGWNDKGDVKTIDTLVECKRTDKTQFTLKLEMLRRHRILALKVGKIPMVQVDFGTGITDRYVILPLGTVEHLLKAGNDVSPEATVEGSEDGG